MLSAAITCTMSDPGALDPFHAVVQQARALAAQRPRCWMTQSDLSAMNFLFALHEKYGSNDLPIVRASLERIRVACETGTYPEHLLKRHRCDYPDARP